MSASKPVSFIAEDRRRWYRFSCPGCGRGLTAPKSETMERGFNSGSAMCLYCGLHLHLRLARSENGPVMLAQKWVDTLGMPIEKLKRQKPATNSDWFSSDTDT